MSNDDNRFKVTVAVHVAILKDEEILLELRRNTGWYDGYYDTVSGHLEPGESILEAAQREVAEEMGLKVAFEDLELFHIAQNDQGSKGPYVYMMFRVKKWHGEPATNDPDRVEELRFFTLNKLPEKIMPYVKTALAEIDNPKITYSHLRLES